MKQLICYFLDADFGLDCSLWSNQSQSRWVRFVHHEDYLKLKVLFQAVPNEHRHTDQSLGITDKGTPHTTSVQPCTPLQHVENV